MGVPSQPRAALLLILACDALPLSSRKPVRVVDDCIDGAFEHRPFGVETYDLVDATCPLAAEPLTSGATARVDLEPVRILVQDCEHAGEPRAGIVSERSSAIEIKRSCPDERAEPRKEAAPLSLDLSN